MPQSAIKNEYIPIGHGSGKSPPASYPDDVIDHDIRFAAHELFHGCRLQRLMFIGDRYNRWHVDWYNIPVAVRALPLYLIYIYTGQTDNFVSEKIKKWPIRYRKAVYKI